MSCSLCRDRCTIRSRRGFSDAIVRLTCAAAAERFAVSPHLALIENLFATTPAMYSLTGTAEQHVQRSREFDPRPGEELVVRHPLIAEELRVPTTGGFGCVHCCALAGLWMRVQSNRRTGVCVHVGRGDLAEIDDPLTRIAAGIEVGSTTVGLDDDEKPFVALR